MLNVCYRPDEILIPAYIYTTIEAGMDFFENLKIIERTSLRKGV